MFFDSDSVFCGGGSGWRKLKKDTAQKRKAVFPTLPCAPL